MLSVIRNDELEGVKDADIPHRCNARNNDGISIRDGRGVLHQFVDTAVGSRGGRDGQC